MKRLTNHLIIVSFDALSSHDYDYIKTLPNFARYLQSASLCKKVSSIYPSLTYPAHTSIITGRYPKNHGIVNNTLLQPNRKSPDWYWYRKYIKGTTLYDEAIKKGLIVAAFLWPVTGRSAIQYNMPEIFANRPWQNQVMVSLLSGSPYFQYVLNKKFGYLRKGIHQPQLDNFTQACLLYTIEKKMPHLVLAHFTDLDTMRHRYGVDSLEALEALRRHDKRLGEIIQRLDASGKDYTLVLLGDHSQLDEKKVIYLNTEFYKKGWLSFGRNRKILKWKVVLKHCDGSAYVYINDREDKEMYQEVYKFLKGKMKEVEGIEALFTNEQAIEKGADPTCAFMLEAKKGYYFLDDVMDEQQKTIRIEELGKLPHITAATHGYLPSKENYTTLFMAKGKGIVPNVEIEKMSLVDEGPTLAKLLGIELGHVDGKVIEAFLN